MEGQEASGKFPRDPLASVIAVPTHRRRGGMVDEYYVLGNNAQWGWGGGGIASGAGTIGR